MTDKKTTHRRQAGRVDAREVLEAIAADPKVPAALRYRAASRLLSLDQGKERAAVRADPARDGDAITRRALEIGAARNNQRELN